MADDNQAPMVPINGALLAARCRYCLARLDSKAEYEDGQCRPCRDDSIIHRYGR
jgi:hypothetical protein